MTRKSLEALREHTRLLPFHCSLCWTAKPFDVKVLHTPDIQFDIQQIRLSPNRKLLAIAGAFQVAVVVLPRSGFSKLVMSRIDCKYVLDCRVQALFKLTALL